MKNRTDEIWAALGAFIEERSVADVLLTISRFEKNAETLVPAMRRALLECDEQARRWRHTTDKGATSKFSIYIYYSRLLIWRTFCCVSDLEYTRRKIKMLCVCLICIFLLTGCATAFNDTNNNKLPKVSQSSTQSYDDTSISDYRVYEVSNAFEIAISDDIWFLGEHSLYFEFLNSSVAYDIYQDNDDSIHIVTTTPILLTGEDDYRYEQYYSFELMSYNDRITNEILSAKFNGNAGELNQEFNSLPIGSGVIEIKEAHKPVYPEFTAEKQVALNKIREQFFSVMSDPQNVTGLYIRDFYDTSDQTVIAYVLGNDAYCYSNASVSGDRVFKPTKIEQEFMYYFDRLVECSFAMDLAPIESTTNSMAEDDSKGYDIPDGKSYYIITEKAPVEYIYEIFDKDGNVALKDEAFRTIPKIELVRSGLLKIAINAGTATTLEKYYDIDKDIFSNWFESPKIENNGLIVYMAQDIDNEVSMVVEDIFDSQKYHKEFKHDFSPIATASSILKNAEFRENGTLYVEYLSGSDYTLICEFLELH